MRGHCGEKVREQHFRIGKGCAEAPGGQELGRQGGGSAPPGQAPAFQKPTGIYSILMQSLFPWRHRGLPLCQAPRRGSGKPV